MAACPPSSSSTRSARPAIGPSARSRWRSAARTCAWRPPSCCPTEAGSARTGERGAARLAGGGLGWHRGSCQIREGRGTCWAWAGRTKRTFWER
eukprot:scaffold47748_cov72-Phaeocystis_antarctica.AAC.1